MKVYIAWDNGGCEKIMIGIYATRKAAEKVIDRFGEIQEVEVSVVANEVEPVWGAESNYPQANESSEPKIPEDMVNAGGKDEQTEVPF